MATDDDDDDDDDDIDVTAQGAIHRGISSESPRSAPPRGIPGYPMKDLGMKSARRFFSQ